jgi:hypothetical protein
MVSGCVFHKKLKPFPPVNPQNPEVWSDEKCKSYSKIWWGKRGDDPSKTNIIWHCADWKIYSKEVAP